MELAWAHFKEMTSYYVQLVATYPWIGILKKKNLVDQKQTRELQNELKMENNFYHSVPLSLIKNILRGYSFN